MPTLNEHHASKVTKLLLLGNSGSGKTGALASLANAGYELFIQDFDNGLDILHQFVIPECKKNVHYVTLTDKMKSVPGRAPIPSGAPEAYVKSVNLLNRWKDGDEDFGGVGSWDESRILVIDSLTLQGRAAMHQIKFINDAVMEADWGYYGGAMEMQEKLLELLHADNIKCNVIVTAHIVPIAPQKRIESTNREGKSTVQTVDLEDPKDFPSALGNKLPPKVGRFFNTILRCKTIPGGRHVIQSVPMDTLELKSTAPLNIPKELELEDGLAKVFEIVRRTATSGEGEEKDVA